MVFQFVSPNRNDTVLKTVLDRRGAGTGWRREMKDAVYCRAMEALCRQSAVFRPLDSWRLLAEAEMWHHKALAEVTPGSLQRNGIQPTAFAAGTEPTSNQMTASI
jgi:hypothetical protein